MEGLSGQLSQTCQSIHIFLLDMKYILLDMKYILLDMKYVFASMSTIWLDILV